MRYGIEQEPALMTVAEAARRFNVTTATVRRHCDDGTLPAIRIGRQWRIHPDAATVVSISERGQRRTTNRLRNR